MPRTSHKTTAAKPVAKATKATKATKPARPATRAKAVKPAKTVKAAKTETVAKPRKAKLVRDSFTMPENEYALIAALKKRCLAAGIAAKKSEVLRAAVATLAGLSDAAVVKAVGALEVIKTGRPPKNA